MVVFSSMEFIRSDLEPCATMPVTIPAKILALVLRLVITIALQSSQLCQNSMAILRTGSMPSHPPCKCDNCAIAVEVQHFDGTFIKITENMTDPEFDERLKMEQDAVRAKLPDMPKNAMKDLLLGKIYEKEGKFLLAADAFMRAFSHGFDNALSLYGKMLEAQAKKTGETAPEMYVFEACVAFLVAMKYYPFAEVYLLRLLLPEVPITLGSIEILYRERANSAIQTWLQQNETKITRCLQNLLDKQAEIVCPHVWEELPRDDPIPNLEDPEKPFTSFCPSCGTNGFSSH